MDGVRGRPYRDDEIVSLIVAYGETALRVRLKAMEGRWNPADKLWHLPYGAIRGDAELEERILRK